MTMFLPFYMEDSKSQFKEELKGSAEEKRHRILWIDMARGFVVFYMVITLIFPDWFDENIITSFLFVHPPREPGQWHLVDVGAPAFVFILGMLFSVTFKKHKARDGTKKAVLHMITRYGMVLLLGIFIIWATYSDGFIYQTHDDWLDDGSQITVFAVDVIFVLGLVGFIGLPFVFLKPSHRIVVAYSFIMLMLILCLLNDYTKIINFSVSSVHLGIYSAIFGYGAVQILGSAFGEYIIFNQAQISNTIKKMIIMGGINVVIGFSLLWFPLTFLVALVLIAIGITFLGLIPFILIDEKHKKKIGLLIAYGKNPFFTYIITAIPAAITYDLLIGTSNIPFTLINLIIVLIIFGLITTILMFLYKREIYIPTMKVGAVAFIVLLVLVILLFQLDLL